MFKHMVLVLKRTHNIWVTVADPEGVRLKPPFETNFLFRGFFQKNQEKYLKNMINLTNQTTPSKFYPPIKKSWIRPWIKK